MTDGGSSRGESWVDEDPGPLVRPYAMTRGRTRPTNKDLDMITLVLAVRAGAERPGLEEDYVAILELCRRPMSIAEIAARLDVPMIVVKVLVSDLLERGDVVMRRPQRHTQAPDLNLLQAVLDGIRRL